MTADKRAERNAPFVHRNYAHRGLHNNEGGVPENSLAAFALAAEKGYGAELDVQLSRDGQVVVFHDDTLNRVCGVNARVDEYNYSALKEMPLLGTGERIPLFTDVLKTFNGGTERPLIVELKTGPRNEELCRKTFDILKQYSGIYCIESFNPMIVKWFRKHAPQVYRGQLASTMEDYLPGQKKAVAFLLSRCALNFLAKPDFIAYKNIEHRPAGVLRARARGTALFAWTSRKPDKDQKENDSVIFEKYRPDPFF